MTTSPAPAMSPRPEILGCPFCGSRPKIKESKTTYCQLHGEPSRSFIVYCDNHKCFANPRVADGNVTWKGHETDERTKACIR